MEIAEQDHIKAKMFAGLLLTSEVRMHLVQSHAWKNACILVSTGTDDLIEVSHDKLDYIGCYIQEEKLQLELLHKYEQFVTDKLLYYCKNLNRNSCHFNVFSQILVK